MFRKRRFMQLPADWEDLGEAELERLWNRAARVQGILPELPPLRVKSDGGQDDSSDDEEAVKRFEKKRRSPGVDRETLLDQQDERAD